MGKKFILLVLSFYIFLNNYQHLLNACTQFSAGPFSNDLLSIASNIIPGNQCNSSYFSDSIPRGLKYGILDDRIICANPVNGIDGTFGVFVTLLLYTNVIYLNNTIKCRVQGDSGGPLQVKFLRSKLYTQFGITSFGTVDHGAPVGYTRVSKYIPWIESVVWPNLSKTLISNQNTNERSNNIANISIYG